MDAPVVGIDVARDRLDIHVHPSGANFAVDRTTEGVEQLCERLRPLKPKLVVLEATGGLEAMVARALTNWRLPAVIVNPAQVRAFAHALGQRAKTDRIDATAIARFAAATNPPVRARADAKTQALADLVTRRRQIVGLIASERQRASQAPSCIRDSVRRVIEALEQEQSVIDRSIDAEVDRSLEWRRKVTLLTSVPGVGPTIARTLIAELPELGSLNGKQVAALVGLAPWTRQSGQWRGRSFIAGGRAPVRTALFMGAMVASRHNAALKTFRDRLIAAGKPKLVALIATARKLITILNAILRDGTLWQPA
ncbi:IS110 family transposase [Methylorubrum extorquens]|nr:IS110 family transposase [Methylorubrum extorquens]